MNQTINGSVLFWVVMAVTVGLLLLGWFKNLARLLLSMILNGGLAVLAVNPALKQIKLVIKT